MLQTERNQALFSRVQRLFNEVLQGLGPNNSKHQAISTSEHTVYKWHTHTGYNLKKKICSIKISVKELSITLEAFLLGANELHLHLSSNQHFLILHTWNTESKAAESFVPQLHLHQQHQLLEQLETLLALLPWFLTLHLSSELKHRSRQLELSSLKRRPSLSSVPDSSLMCSVFCLLARNTQQIWFDQPNQWARATYTEWIFWTLFNRPCHQSHKHLGNRSELVAGNFRKSSVFNLLHWMTLQL